MTGNISHPIVRKAEMTLFAFRGAKSHEWTFCDPIKLMTKTGHQRAPGGAPKSMTGDLGHGFVRKAEMTLFAFRGAKSHEWTFCDPINRPEKKDL
jgi:hypothetical protein